MKTKGPNLSKMSPKKRHEFVLQNLYNKKQPIETVYYQENHDHAGIMQKQLKTIDVHGYSAIGLAAVSIKVLSLMPTDKKEYFNEESYKEKKHYIKQLKKLGIKATSKDKQLLLQIKKEARMNCHRTDVRN